MGGVRIGQSSHMVGHALSQGRDGSQVSIVAALKHAHEPALAAVICDLLQLTSHPLVVELSDHGLTGPVQVILLMSIKASADQNEIRLEFQKTWDDSCGEGLSEVSARSVEERCKRHVKDTTWVHIRLATCVL